MSSLAVGLLFLGALQLPTPPPPRPSGIGSRDAASETPAAKGTAVIRGVVTQPDTGEPVPRAMVRLMPADGPRQPGERPISTRTGADGRYEITQLPAGRYVVKADPGEFRAWLLPQNLGDPRPLDYSRRSP